MRCWFGCDEPSESHPHHGRATYPAAFQLVLAANPCPCGKAGGRGLECTCTSLQRRRYFSRLSGPLLDRVDIQVEVAPVSASDLAHPARSEPSAVVAQRVLRARRAAKHRLAGTPWRLNAIAFATKYRFTHPVLQTASHSYMCF